MQDVAEASCASKETLYRHFGSKDGLVSEIIENRLQRLGWQVALSSDDGDTGEVTLFKSGTKLLRAWGSPEHIALLRMVIAESPRYSKLAECYYAAGPGSILAQCIRMMTELQQRGLLALDDPEASARIFIGVILSLVILERVVLSDPPQFSSIESEQSMKQVLVTLVKMLVVEQQRIQQPF